MAHYKVILTHFTANMRENRDIKTYVTVQTFPHIVMIELMVDASMTSISVMG